MRFKQGPTFAAENAIPEKAYLSAMTVIPFSRSLLIAALKGAQRHRQHTSSISSGLGSFEMQSGAHSRTFPSIRSEEQMNCTIVHLGFRLKIGVDHLSDSSGSVCVCVGDDVKRLHIVVPKYINPNIQNMIIGRKGNDHTHQGTSVISLCDHLALTYRQVARLGWIYHIGPILQRL